jgi:predicted aminopeptidase
MPLKRPRIRRRPSLLALLLAVGLALTGCQTVSYYAQAVRGHCQVLARRQSSAKLIADPNTPQELRARLEVAAEICAFARRELELPVNGHYQSYADVDRRYVVWNVTASPEFSLESKTWWYPLVGSLDYRGYFAERDARKYADRLSQKGFDVTVEGVEAYSTLGWFKDPLLNTFIHHSDAALAEILFHELAHQRVFASGDTDFNEAFATAVGQEGARRWLRRKGSAASLEEYLTALQRHVQFVRLVADARKKLEALYGDEHLPDGKLKATKRARGLPPDQLRIEKQLIQDGLGGEHEKLKREWGGHAGYEEWFTGSLNNARLNSVATYYDLVPAFERLLVEQGGDLDQFYAAVKRLSKLPKAERHRRLMLQPPSPSASAGAE